MVDISKEMNTLVANEIPPFLALLLIRGEENESIYKSYVTKSDAESVFTTKNESVLSTTSK